MRVYDYGSVQQYERKWFDRLETILPGELRNLIDHNNAINQSASFKYNTVVKFIIQLCQLNRVNLAQEVLNKYWSKLDRFYLVESLFVFGDFELFKNSWKKNRTIIDDRLMLLLIRTDEIERAKWLVKDKKFLNNLTDESFSSFEQNFTHLKFINKEVIEMVSTEPKIMEFVTKGNYDSLLPSSVKDVFLF